MKMKRRLSRLLKSLRLATTSGQSGMSLIEIIIVIALMGTLMTIVISKLTGAQDEAMKDAARLAMQKMDQNLQMYKVHNYKYPTTDQGLDALVNQPSGATRWRGPYAEADKIKDPWGNPLGYESDGRNFKIISGGADGEVGNSDDIVYPTEGKAAGGGESGGGEE
jgi:general secretion pathway protein G